MKYDIIISINVHNKPEYLLKQIENINEFVLLKKKIILNCNDFMFEYMKNVSIPDVEVFPEPLNKRTFHGSLTKGIVSNMKFSLDNYNFKYFLVMSSREFFYRILDNLDELTTNIHNHTTSKDYSVTNWSWPEFKRTKLFQYLQKNNLTYSSSAHEGMCFTNDSCKYIINFLDNNLGIADDLFNFNWCVEEFAIQSICSNYSQYYYIGNGCETKSINQVDTNRYTHKRVR